TSPRPTSAPSRASWGATRRNPPCSGSWGRRSRRPWSRSPRSTAPSSCSGNWMASATRSWHKSSKFLRELSCPGSSMPGPRCRSCCRSRWASPCLPKARRTDGGSPEYESGCLRPTTEGPVVMSLNPTHLQLLSAYLDGELTAAERETVERALAADPQLQKVEQSMRGLGSAMRAASDAAVAKADFSGLADRITARGARRRGALARRRAVRNRSWLPIGGLVGVAAGGFLTLSKPVVPAAGGVDVQSASVVEASPELRPV